MVRDSAVYEVDEVDEEQAEGEAGSLGPAGSWYPATIATLGLKYDDGYECYARAAASSTGEVSLLEYGDADLSQELGVGGQSAQPQWNPVEWRFRASDHHDCGARTS